jgi:hypothetical protein
MVRKVEGTSYTCYVYTGKKTRKQFWISTLDRVKLQEIKRPGRGMGKGKAG